MVGAIKNIILLFLKVNSEVSVRQAFSAQFPPISCFFFQVRQLCDFFTLVFYHTFLIRLLMSLNRVFFPKKEKNLMNEKLIVYHIKCLMCLPW